MTAIDWAIGFSIAFGLALIFALYTDFSLETVLVFLAIFVGFMVWAGVLPFWTLTLSLIMMFVLIYVKLTKGSVSAE